MLNETILGKGAPIGMKSISSAHARPGGTPALIDRFGRKISYVRLSITDRCDFRCSYCMSEKMVFLPRAEILSLEECFRLVSIFVGFGVSKVRITGGEPLVRQDALWLLQRLGSMPGLDNLVLTTNGSQLERFADRLRAAGVQRLNISLDTLKPELFRQITRTGDVHKVLRGIAAVRSAGFTRTKINVVMMRGVNDGEFADLVRFAMDNELDISFIEEMPLGPIAGRVDTYLSSEEARDRLTRDFDLLPSPETTGGPARYWRLPGHATRIGFISPHSHNFCDTCNRVRITAKGELFPCLGHNDAISLLPLLRAHPEDDEPVRQAIIEGMGLKPLGHDFNHQLASPQVLRFMSMTGG